MAKKKVRIILKPLVILTTILFVVSLLTVFLIRKSNKQGLISVKSTWECSSTGEIVSLLNPYIQNGTDFQPDKSVYQYQAPNWRLFWKEKVDEPFFNVLAGDVIDRRSKDYPQILTVGSYIPTETIATISSEHRKIKQALITTIIPILNKKGVKLMYEEEMKHPNAAGEVTSFYFLQKNNEYYNINISSFMQSEESVKIMIRCSVVTVEKQHELSNLREIAQYSGWDAGTIPSLSQQIDNVYVVGTHGIYTFGGSSHWFTKRGDQWVNLFSGQVEPPCDIFEQNKVGKSMNCTRCNPRVEICEESTVQY